MRLIVYLFCAFALITNAFASNEFPTCRLSNGDEVVYRAVPTWFLNGNGTALAAAVVGFQGPIIFYDDKLFAKLSPVHRDFILAHECAHHTRGHFGAYLSWGSAPAPESTFAREKDADCTAVNSLKRKGYTDSDFARLFRAMEIDTPIVRASAESLSIEKLATVQYETLEKRVKTIKECMTNE
jgi:hypothetical protein